MKKLIFILLAFLVSDAVFSQVSLARRIKYAQDASPKDKQLILIDFWATWCAPCITAAEYLSGVQKQFPDDLYIVSLAYEDEDKIADFIERHPTPLAVSIDDNSKNFKHYEAKRLPYSVLFNASGTIVWKGHPADLKPAMINRFLNRNKKRVEINDFITYTNPSIKGNEQSANNYIPQKYNIADYTITEEAVPYTEHTASVRKNENYTIVRGNLPQVFAFLMGLNDAQVKTESEFNQSYTIIIKEGQKKATAKEIADELMDLANSTYLTDNQLGEFYEITLPKTDQMFWDNEAIQWGVEDRSAFIIESTSFKADNITPEIFLYKLSNLAELPIIVKNKNENRTEVYDWEIDYKFPNIMEESLQSLGMKVAKKEGTYHHYTLRKKS